MQENENDVYEIDLLQLAEALIKRWWIILLASIIVGAATFGITRVFVTPKYQTSIMLYVNNNDITFGGAKLDISSADITASRSLVDTYGVILKANLTLQDIADSLNTNTKLHNTYSYRQLSNMISSRAENNTEIMRITVECTDQADGEIIANTIAEVLPKRISRIIEGTSVSVVDLAEYPISQSYPSPKKNALIGFAVAFVLSCAVILIYDIFFQDVINKEDFLRDTFSDTIPILAIIPEIGSKHRHNKYAYYSAIVSDETTPIDEVEKSKGVDAAEERQEG